MLLEELVLPRLKHPRGHGLVLDAHVGQEGRGEAPLQVHGPQPLHIEGGNGVAALPQLLELRRREVPQGGEQPSGLRQKPGQPPGRQGVSVLPHLLGGGNDDPHGGLLLRN